MADGSMTMDHLRTARPSRRWRTNFAACLLTCGMTLFGLAGDLSAASGDGAQAAPDKSSPDALTVKLSARADQLVELLAGATSSDQDSAGKALLALDGSYVDALAGFLDDPDLEVRHRVLEILRESSIEARIVRAMSMLPPDQRTKLILLRQHSPLLLANAFSNDLGERTSALRRLAKVKDPQRLVEPLVIMCLRHSSADLQLAALEVQRRNRYDSPMIVDALVDLGVANSNQRNYGYPYQYGWDDQPRANPQETALLMLERMRVTRAAPKLAAALLSPQAYARPALVSAILSTDEKRLIPTLVKQLDNSATRSATYSFEDNGVRMDVAKVDTILAVLVQLTNQSLSEYKLLTTGRHQYAGAYGFASVDDRQQAIGQFKKWWSKNKDVAPWKGLTPLEQTGSGTSASQTQSPAPSTGSAPSTNQDVFRTAQLQGQIKARVVSLVEQLRSSNLAQRRRAHEGILAVHKSFLLALLEGTAGREGPPAVLEVLTDITVQCEAMAQVGRLTRAMRLRALKFRKEHEDIFDEYFSISWARQARAMNRLAKLSGSTGDAEPLLLMGLRHPSGDVQRQALQAASSGRYKSDEVVDAVCDLMLEDGASSGNTSRMRYRNYDDVSFLAAQTLKRIGSRRAAPALLAMMFSGQNNYDTSRSVFADAMAATGEPLAIPALLKGLDLDKSNHWSWSYNKVRGTTALTDPYIYVLVKLTGQKPKDYGMITVSGNTGGAPYQNSVIYIGFADDNARTAAIARFRTWWQTNKDMPAYKGRPLSVPPPDAPANRQRPPAPEEE